MLRFQFIKTWFCLVRVFFPQRLRECIVLVCHPQWPTWASFTHSTYWLCAHYCQTLQQAGTWAWNEAGTMCLLSRSWHAGEGRPVVNNESMIQLHPPCPRAWRLWFQLPAASCGSKILNFLKHWCCLLLRDRQAVRHMGRVTTKQCFPSGSTLVPAWVSDLWSAPSLSWQTLGSVRLNPWPWDLNWDFLLGG